MDGLDPNNSTKKNRDPSVGPRPWKNDLAVDLLLGD